MSGPLFSTQDASYLEDVGLLSASKSGMRKVSAATMYSVRSIDSDSSSGDSSADSRHIPAYATRESTVMVPEIMESSQTLEWLGFNHDTAQQLLQKWKNFHPDDPSDFLTVALEHLEYHSCEDACGDHEDWLRTFADLGIADELESAIMDPVFKRVRLTHSAKEWISETLQGRFEFLAKTQNTSVQRVKLLHEEAIQRRITARKTSGTSIEGDIPENSAPQIKYVTAYPQYIPGSTTLWIGHSGARLESIFVDGSIDLTQILSAPRSDFASRYAVGVYTALQREVAEIYANYAKRRIGNTPVCLLSIQIPNALIHGFDPLSLPYGDLWRKVVWTCRSGNRLRGELASIATRKLLIGPICGHPSKTIANKRDWKEIEEQDLIRCMSAGKEQEATQYFFKDETTLNTLSDNAEFALHSVGSQGKDFL